MIRKPWTEADDRRLRKLWGLPIAELCRRMGRGQASIYGHATRLGLTRKLDRHEWTPKALADLRRLNAAGWSDTRIAHAFECERHTISRMRQALGLPCRAAEARRGNVGKQLATLGLSAPNQLRLAAWQARAAALGWPATINGRSVNVRHLQILELLWVAGPQTREQVVRRLGMARTRQNHWLASNGPGGSYLAELMRAGLVERSAGRLVAGRGKGRSRYLFALAPGVAPHRERKA